MPNFDERAEAIFSKVYGREPQTSKQRTFVGTSQEQPKAEKQPSSDERMAGYLARLEKMNSEMNERSQKLFTVDLQQKLVNTLTSTPEYKELLKARTRLSGEAQTRFTSELGDMPPSAEVDPLAQLDAASSSRANVARALSGVQTSIESGRGLAQGVVKQLLEAEAKQKDDASDEFSRTRQILADTLDVQQDKRQARTSQGGTGSTDSSVDEIGLINLALDSLSKEERQQINLLPTKDRKAVLISIGREVQQERTQGYQNFKAEQGLDKMSLLPNVEQQLQNEYTQSLKPTQSVEGLDDLPGFEEIR